MMDWTLCAFADEADAKISGQITALKKNDIPCLEVRGVDGKNISDLTPEEARELRKRLDDAGVRVWSLGSPMGKISLTDDFEAHLDKFRRTLELGDILGASALRMFSFFLPEGVTPAEGRGQVIDQLGRMIDAAKGSALTLCHENEKGIYGAMAAECADLHAVFPTLRAVFDPANFIQCGQPTLPAWELLHPYVEYYHVKDAFSDGRVVPAGCGEGHLPQLLAAYKAQGGKVLTLEPHLSVFDGLKALEREGEETKIDTYAYPTPEAAFDAAVDALKGILATL